MIRLIACEGAHDRAAVEAVKKAGLLEAEHIVWPKRGDRLQGLDAQAKQVRAWLDSGEPVVALRDADDLTAALAADRLATDVKGDQLEAVTLEGRARDDRVAKYVARGTNGEVALRVVVVGLPGEPLLGELGVLKRFTIDDLLLRMLLDDEVYEAFRQKERTVEADAALVRAKVGELRDVLRQNAIPVESSAQFVALLCGAINFRASRADLVERLVTRGPVGRVAGLLQPWLDDLKAAADA
jgi:hypothetical protein